MKETLTPVKDSLVVFTEGAKVNFNLYQKVAPVFGCNIKGTPRIMPVIFAKPEDKDAFRQKILAMIARDELKEFVFVCECWLATVPNESISEIADWLAKNGSLETFPTRQEAVQVLYASPAEEICYTALINRSSMGVTLSGWEVQKSSGRVNLPDLATRFQGLFSKGKAGSN
jgi:hypothetical protein